MNYPSKNSCTSAAVILCSSLLSASAFADSIADFNPTDKLCWSTFRSPLDSGVGMTARPKIEYPSGEGLRMGEGWVDLRFTIGPDGVPRNHSVQDAVGSEIYAPYAIRGMSQARYEGPTSKGVPVPMNISSSPVDFHVEGTNRVGVHDRYQNDQDRAFKLRHEGKFQEAVDIMEETIRQPLSLYALTSAAFELSRSYQEMGLAEDALFHIRHATIDDASYIDKGLKREALTRRIELEAATHNYWEAVCAYERFRKQYKDQALESQFQMAANQSREQLLGKGNIETDVRMIDRKRGDIASFWRRRLIRNRVTVNVSSDQITRAQVVCSTKIFDLPPGPTMNFEVPAESGGCDLYVFAPAQTSFHALESN